jgi:hypothetical protein
MLLYRPPDGALQPVDIKVAAHRHGALRDEMSVVAVSLQCEEMVLLWG